MVDRRRRLTHPPNKRQTETEALTRIPDQDGRNTARAGRSFPWTTLGLGLAMVIFTAYAVPFWYPTEDAFIAYRYSWNLAHGFGPVYNPGDVPVEGYTSPLWMLLGALALLLGLLPDLSTLALGYAAGAATMFLAHRAGARLFPGRHPVAYLVAPLFLAANRTFAAFSVSGLETSFFTFLVAAAFYRLAIEEIASDSRPWSGLLFAAATLTRPEGAGFFLVAFALRALLRLRARRRPDRRDAAWATGWALPAAAFLAFRLAYYGYPLPNTFYAKVPGLWWAMGDSYLAAFFWEYAMFLILPIAAIGILTSAGRERAVAAAGLALCVPYVAYVAGVGGDAAEFRFMHVTLPFVALLAQQGIVGIAARLTSGRSPAYPALAGALAVVVLAAANVVPLTQFSSVGGAADRRIAPQIDQANRPLLSGLPFFRWWFARYNAAYRQLDGHTVAMRNEDGKALWRRQCEDAWLGQRALADGLIAKDERIAIAAAGIVPYYLGLRTLDVLGLNDGVIAHQPAASRKHLGHDKVATFEYAAFVWAADYVSVSRGFFLDADELRRSAEICRDCQLYVAPYRGRYFTFETGKSPNFIAQRFAGRGYAVYALHDRKFERLPPAPTDRAAPADARP